MKTRDKKLMLNRETLVELEQGDLQQAAGGVTLGCPYSGYRTCNTCAASCTTNYC